MNQSKFGYFLMKKCRADNKVPSRPKLGIFSQNNLTHKSRNSLILLKDVDPEDVDEPKDFF